MGTIKLYVGNLPFSCDNNQLGSTFAAYGTVISANIIVDRENGRSKGFGFIEMEEDQANAAISGLNGKPLDGRPLTVNQARPREEGGRSGGGRDNDRGHRSNNHRNRYDARA